MIGARIAALRREAGLKQSELACVLQISSSAIGMYEQGRRQVPVQMISNIAEFFNVSTDYLIRGTIGELEQQRVDAALLNRVEATDVHLKNRMDRPFSRQELAVLFASMLMDT